MTDVCLCEYTDHGHCGVIRDGEVQNDETLPLLARYAVSEDAQVGPRIGVLYAVNTFGAIAGTLVAAFLLLPELGLRQTVYVGIAGNAIVFLAAAALAHGIAGVPTEHDGSPAGRRGVFRIHVQIRCGFEPGKFGCSPRHLPGVEMLQQASGDQNIRVLLGGLHEGVRQLNR